tara:strand:- start:32 stop:583 length:552 start_codon:yes stop_codon:yes gene_type:complete
MKKIIFTLALLLATNIYSQSIYKGLEFGMSKSEAKKEFKANKSDYITVDLGNGFLYRIYQQNFIYDQNRLVGVLFSPKGAAFGISYERAKNYLIHTRGFFERLGYETYIENKWWNAPLNYVSSGSKWGLVLNKKDKTTIVQMYPQSVGENYLIALTIWNYDTWVGYLNKEESAQKKKADESGF